MVSFRILMITPAYKPSWVYGGPTYSVSALAESLVKKGINVEVIASNANGDKDLDFKNGHVEVIEGVHVSYYRRWSGDQFSFAPILSIAVLRSIRKFNVVHINGWWNWISVMAVIICKLSGKPFVLSPRGSISTYTFGRGKSKSMKKWVHNLFLRSILNNSFFHFSSELERKDASLWVPKMKSALVPNLLNLPFDLKIERKENALFTIIFLGRIDPKKNIELLVQSMEHVSFPCQLNIVGDGEEGYLAKLKQDYQHNKNIQWIGPCYNDNKFRLLANADLFALLSYSENYGNAVIESLSVGTPVMVSEHVGAGDFVAAHQLGWMVSLDLPHCITALQAAHDEKERVIEIRQKAPDLIRKYFSPEALAEKYIQDCYETVV